MGAQRQIGLDAVRGIAIAMVLGYHFDQPVGVDALDGVLAPLRTMGWAGVELFFVLSGFLVGGIILEESDGPAGFNWRRFVWRRALRLWPILYLYLAAMALSGLPFNRLWPAVIHLQNYSLNAPMHLWSLAVEEHFYLAAAVVLPGLSGPRTARRLIATLVAVIVVVNVARIAAVATGAAWAVIHWQTQSRIDALTAGVLLATVARYRPAIFATAQRHCGSLVVCALIGYAVLLLASPFLSRWSLNLSIAWLAAVPLVVAASGLETRAAMVRPARLLAALGRIAYPLYIWHICVANLAVGVAVAGGIADPVALAVVRWGSAIAFAAVLHRSVELPFMALRNRLDRPRVTPRGSPAAV